MLDQNFVAENSTGEENENLWLRTCVSFGDFDSGKRFCYYNYRVRLILSSVVFH